MVSCAFCSTQKAPQYLYTVCQHFICINCAALRAKEGLKCCGVITTLSQEVKNQLQRKKQSILSNLSKDYQFDRTQFDEKALMGNYKTTQKKDMIRISQNSEECRRTCNFNQVEEEHSFVKEMERTPINKLYCRKNSQNNQLQNTETQSRHEESYLGQNFYRSRQMKDESFKPQFENSQIIEKQRENHQGQNLEEKQFLQIYENKVQQIRCQFQAIYDELKKKEATIIYQSKIYYEQYYKLVAAENKLNPLNPVLQKEKLNVYLNQFLEKWNLKQIKAVIQASPIKKNFQKLEKQDKNAQSTIEYKSYQNQVMKEYLSKKRPSSAIKSNKKENLPFNDQNAFLRNIKNEEDQRKNSFTSRNMNKIYKKLEQSKSKLQERIGRHNTFMSERCNIFNEIKN